MGKTYKDKQKWQEKEARRKQGKAAKWDYLREEKDKEYDRHWIHHKHGEDLDEE